MAPTEPLADVSIQDLPTLRALTDPTRLKILGLVGIEAKTVREMAANLGLARNRVHYHVNVLERHGLLRVAETRQVNGATERRFIAVSRTFDTSRVPMPAAASAAMAGIVGSAAPALNEAIQSRRRHVVGQARLRLSPEAYAELAGRIDELIREYEAVIPAGAEGLPFNLVFAVYEEQP